MASDEQVRSRARELWEQAGKPEGRDEEFWYRAEEEFREKQELGERTREPPAVLPG